MTLALSDDTKGTARTCKSLLDACQCASAPQVFAVPFGALETCHGAGDFARSQGMARFGALLCKRQHAYPYLAAALVRRQKSGEPAHTWEVADIHEAGGWRLNYLRVEQYMTTSLFTVHEDELVDMVAFLMDRNEIRHVLVEDDQHRLTGIVSYRSLIRLMAEESGGGGEAPPVKAIMERDPVSVAPETPTLDAIDLMRRHRVSCLPVVKHGKLVGIVSERDFMPIAYELLEDKLRES